LHTLYIVVHLNIKPSLAITMHIKKILLKPFLIVTLLCSSIFAQAQFTSNTKQTFNSAASFIENIGQYGTTYKGQESMGNILYGFEGHSMPILFTKKGIIILQRKVESRSQREKQKLEKQGIPEETIEHKKTVTDRAITLEWLGANTNVQILQEEKAYDYHTYGLIKEKAYGYKKITYKNLYNGIDLVYNFTNNSKIGFEYSLHIAAGADISQIKMQYGGDVKKIKTNKQGKLLIKSDIEGVEQSIPISYYTQMPSGEQTTDDRQRTTGSRRQTTDDGKQTTDHGLQTTDDKKQTTDHGLETTNIIKETTNKLITNYSITNHQVSFQFKEAYDHTKPITIDPFVSSTSNLDGVNVGKAKDIDFDYAGNVYVTGGGDAGTNHRLSKYNAAGVLQWTFNGVLTHPLGSLGQLWEAG
jgi:hypothetical protein